MKEHSSLSDKKTRFRFDDIKRIIARVEGTVEVGAFTVLYYYFWKWFYRDLLIEHHFYGNGKLVLMGIYAGLVLMLFYLFESFKFGHRKLSDVVMSQWIALILTNVISYFQICLIANVMIRFWPILALTAVEMALSLLLVTFYTYIYHRNYVPKNMVMIYGNDNAVNLKFKMDSRPDKYTVTKILNVNSGFETISQEIRDHDAVIINDVPSQIRNDILKYCYRMGIRTYVVPKISDIIVRGAYDINLFDTPLLLVKARGLSPSQRFVKRTMDILLCLIALIPGAPIMLLIALAIKLEDHGPVFYRQKRVTRGGREFDILKFRSMIVDAEKGGYTMAMRANGKDPRITRVGRVIRACRVDELPQLLNILKGDMSLVGPRPERVENVSEYSEQVPEFAYRNKVKGGLTGYAQIYGKYNTGAYDKIRLDLMYIENYSIFLDIKLLLMTLKILITPESTEGFEKAEELEQKKEQLLKQEEFPDDHIPE